MCKKIAAVVLFVSCICSFAFETFIPDSLVTENVEITNADVLDTTTDSMAFFKDGNLNIVPLSTFAEYFSAGSVDSARAAWKADTTDVAANSHKLGGLNADEYFLVSSFDDSIAEYLALTSGYVPYYDGAKLINSALYYNGTNWQLNGNASYKFDLVDGGDSDEPRVRFNMVSGYGGTIDFYDVNEANNCRIRSFSVGGVQAWLTAGKVGIGTDSPAELLHVHGEGVGFRLSNSLDNSMARYGISTGYGSYNAMYDDEGNLNAYVRAYQVGGVQGYFAAGAMGFGTNTPTAMVHCNGTMKVESTAYFHTCANAGTDPDKFLVLDAGDRLDHRTGSELLSDLSGDASSSFSWNGQELDNLGHVGIGVSASSTYSLLLDHGSDATNIILLRGADQTSEYAGIGLDDNEAIFTAGHGSDEGNTNLVFRTSDAGVESEQLRIAYDGTVTLQAVANAG
ncbi:MAG: hypothetical protein KJN62_02470, partial [Deltaproteobacteria bacterium]|nr:hypothetical protein [Deltaproteobacteria bacterium]